MYNRYGSVGTESSSHTDNSYGSAGTKSSSHTDNSYGSVGTESSSHTDNSLYRHLHKHTMVSTHLELTIYVDLWNPIKFHISYIYLKI